MAPMTKYEQEVRAAENAAALRRSRQMIRSYDPGYLWGQLHADDPGRGTAQAGQP
jgi:hypothetical protein